jgi:hypothetical protein
MDLQREQVSRLAAQLPLPQLQLPYLFNADLGPPELEQLARELLHEIVKLEGGPR